MAADSSVDANCMMDVDQRHAELRDAICAGRTENRELWGKSEKKFACINKSIQELRESNARLKAIVVEQGKRLREF